MKETIKTLLDIKKQLLKNEPSKKQIPLANNPRQFTSELHLVNVLSSKIDSATRYLDEIEGLLSVYREIKKK